MSTSASTTEHRDLISGAIRTKGLCGVGIHWTSSVEVRWKGVSIRIWNRITRRRKSGLPGTRGEGKVKTREDPTGNAKENVSVGARSITRDEDAGNVEACEGAV